MSTIFISHSSKDNELAKDLMRRLERKGHTSTFLDLDPEEGIVAGESWERTLYRKVRACRAVVALCTDDYLKSHWCFAELALARMEGKHLMALLVDGMSEGAKLPSILTEKQFIDMRVDPDEGWDRFWAGLTEKDVLGIGGDYNPRKDGPYLGLSAFEERHAGIFFGRDKEIREGLEALERGAPRLVMVLGASGSGKSSLARAGLVPRLRRAPDEWIILDPIRPSADPFEELSLALEDAYAQLSVRKEVRNPSSAEICERLMADAEHKEPVATSSPESEGSIATPSSDERLPRLLGALQGMRQDPPDDADETLLDFLDWSLEDLRLISERRPVRREPQETITRGGTPLVSIAHHLRRAAGRKRARVLLIIDQFEEFFEREDQELADRFLTLIRASVEAERGALMVLGTMRSDFLDQFQSSPALGDVAYEKLSLGPMQRDGMLQVIERPAAAGDIVLEPGLADLLLADTGTADALPLLSFTLWKLHKGYTGRDDRLLEVSEYKDLGGLHGAMAKEAGAAADRAETRGAKDQLERAFLRMAKLTEGGGYARRAATVDDPEIEPVLPILQDFADRRLVVFRKEGDTQVVEVAHEALFRSWEPLKYLLDRHHADLLLQAQIARDAKAWQSDRRHPTWGGPRLLQARALMKRGQLEPVEEAFVRAGMLRRRIGRVSAAAVVGIVVGSLLTTAVVTRSAQARTENAARVATAAEWVLDGHPTDAALTLLEIETPEEVPGAFTRMANALMGGAALVDVRHGDGIYRVAFDPTGRRIVTAGRDGVALMWDATTGVLLDTLATHPDELSSVAFSPDGGLVVTAGGVDHAAVVWDVATGDSVRALEHTEWVNSARFGGPNGRHIVTASDDGTAQVWDEGGEPLQSLTLDPADSAWVLTAAFSPDGSRIVTGDDQNHAIIWSSRGVPLDTLVGHGDAVSDAAFGPDGRLMVTASRDGTARVWDASTGDPVRVLRHGDWVNTAAFSPDGRTILTASHDLTARLWDTATGEEIRSIGSHAQFVLSAAFNPDGTRFVTAGDDARAFIWETVPPTREALFETGSWRLPLDSAQVAFAQFAPTGERMIVVTGDGAALIWDLGATDSLRTLLGSDAEVEIAAISPSGDRVVTSGRRGVRVWDADQLSEVARLNGPTDSVHAVRFSRDGELLITARGSSARVWDARSGEPLGPPLRGHADSIIAALLLDAGRAITVSAGDEPSLIWDWGTGRSAPLHLGMDVNALLEHPDGERVVGAGYRETLGVWDVATMQPAAGLPIRHRWFSVEAAFSGDGSRVMTTGGDETSFQSGIAHTVHVWDVASGVELWSRRFPSGIRNAAFLLDGARVFALGRDGTAGAWDLSTSRLWGIAETRTKVCMDALTRTQIGILSSSQADLTYRDCVSGRMGER